MNTILNRIYSTLLPKKEVSPELHHPQTSNRLNVNVAADMYFPSGFHVHGISEGPEARLMVGAGNPSTGEGCVFLQQENLSWKEISLPDETAWLSRFLKLPNGSYVASGMTLLGRAAILVGDKTAENWKSIDLDLHAYSMINEMVRLNNGDIIAATGKMITQGKTKPVLIRSQDDGVTWAVEEVNLPITQFFSLHVDGNRVYGGPSGDHNPTLYYSDDFASSWQALSGLPSFKTYKTIAFQPVIVHGKRHLLAVMWGYKIDIADRVVRLYLSDEKFQTWQELPPVRESHFLFSFYVNPNFTFYAGSEKGEVLCSKDFANTWEVVEKFGTNIGAYAIFQDRKKNLWFGKDFVEPHHQSLWTLRTQTHE